MTTVMDQQRAADGLYASALAAQQAGRYAEAVLLLGQASQAGHVAAMTLLGGQLLFGRGAPPDPPRGLNLILQAANLGGGAACALAATLRVSGAIGARNWEQGLDFLQRGAEAGHQGAQSQLKLLADPTGRPPRAGSTWAQVRRQVSLKSWLSPPTLKVVSADPEIRASSAFTTKAVCDWIIQGARDRLQPAPVFSNQTSDQRRMDIRTNSYAGFDLTASDVVVLMVRERLGVVSGLAVENMEAPQALHYGPGQQYGEHFDFLDADLPGHRATLERGQRIATLLLYLNDAYQGGETEFPELGIRHRGRTGGVLMFRNADASGKGDRRMLHAGLPPASGEKWILSLWVRDRNQLNIPN